MFSVGVYAEEPNKTNKIDMQNSRKELINPLKNEYAEKIHNINLSDILSLSNENLSEDARLIKNYFIRLIRHMPNNIYWVDKNGITLGCNDNVLKFVGVTHLEDIVGKSYEEIAKMAGWTKEQSEAFKNDDQEVIQTGKPKINIEEPVFYDQQGKAIYYLSSRLPLFDQHNEIIGVVGISINIADRKEKERLHVEHMLAEQKAQTSAVIAASIAHELRTPLATIDLLGGKLEEVMGSLISGYRQACEQGLIEHPLPEKSLNFVAQSGSRILDVSHSANTFVDMMLMKVNLDQEKIKLKNPMKISILSAVHEALDKYPFYASDKQLIQWDTLSNQKENFYFMGDQTLFNHILFNLLKNALYYIKKAGKGKIEMWLTSDQSGHILHFKDTGSGIAPSILPHIFDEFYSQTAHGTGVGLALCKVIMREFGGEIDCQSREGEYTHFTLTFPKSQNLRTAS